MDYHKRQNKMIDLSQEVPKAARQHQPSRSRLSPSKKIMSTQVGEDEFFPPLLTGGATSPKKSKENSSLGSNQHSFGDTWAVKRGPRLTFAESLSMDKKKHEPTLGDVDVEESPFNFGRTTTAFARRRHPTAQDDDDDDDVPPPPTSSLADPSGAVLNGHQPGRFADELPYRPSETASSSLNSSFFHGDDWGYDKQYWVTVYGFPASSKLFILQQFQTLGEVISYTSGAGNWLHIRYHTRLQAEKALSQDAKTLAGSIMIGVKRCLASDLDGAKQEPTSSLYYSSARKNPGSKDLEVDPIKEEDIMLPPRRRQDICSRLLGFLFNW